MLRKGREGKAVPYQGILSTKIFVIAASMVLLLTGSPVFSAARVTSPLTRNGEITARSVFWLLPTTIFENTSEGLSDEEKYALFIQGASAHWAIREATPDLLKIVSQPQNDAIVLLRLFRDAGNKNVVAAVGTDTGSMCAAELWSVDGAGHATPMETPAEPDLLDFFTPGAHIPRDVTASLPFCVQPEGLEVKPLFWTSTGLAHVMVDNAVFYVWTGKRFSKRVVPLPQYPSPTIDEPQDEATLYTLPEDFPDDARPDQADSNSEMTDDASPRKAHGLTRQETPPALDSDGLPLSLMEEK